MEKTENLDINSLMKSYLDEANSRSEIEYEIAIIVLIEEIKKDPDNMELINSLAERYFSLSFVLVKNKKYDESLLKIEEAIKLKPNNNFFQITKSYILGTQATILYKENKLDLAMEKFNESLKINSENLHFRYLKAKLLCDQAFPIWQNGQVDEASAKLSQSIKSLNKLIKLDPNSELYSNGKSEVLSRQAIIFYGEGKYKDAMNKLDEAIKLSPNNADLKSRKELFQISLLNNQPIFSNKKPTLSKHQIIDNELKKGEELYSLGKYKDALKVFEEVIKKDLNNIHALSMKGTILNTIKEYEKAIICYDDIIASRPFGSNAYYLKEKEANANYNKGISYDGLKKYEKAIECYDKSLKFNNKDTEALMLKVKSLFNLAKYDQALACCEYLIKIDSTDKEAEYYKKKIVNQLNGTTNFIKDDEYEDSDDKSEAININNKEAIKLNNDGLSLLNLKLYDQAIVFFDKAIKLEPEFISAYQNKGNAYQNTFRHESAVECYNKVLSINPNFINALNNKGGSLTRLNKFNEALDCYIKALNLCPNDFELLGNIATLYAHLKDYIKSVEYYDKAIEINNESSILFENKANSLNFLKRYEDAIICYDHIIELEPQNPKGYYSKSNSLWLIGKIEEAEYYYNEGFRLEYDEKYEKAYTYQSQGLYEEAIKAYDDLIDSNNESCNDGIIINKILCTIYKDNKNQEKLTNDTIVEKIYTEINSLKIQPSILKESSLLKTKKNNDSISLSDFEENKSIEKAKEYFKKVKKLKETKTNNDFKSVLTKHDIKSYIDSDFINKKYSVELKYENDGKLKKLKGYKIGTSPVCGYQYWGVLDIDLKKNSNTELFVKVLNDAVYTGISRNCTTGVKYITNCKRSVYEIKIQADARIYSDTVAENSLNKVIIFDHLGNHTSVSNFLKSNSKKQDLKIILQDIVSI